MENLGQISEVRQKIATASKAVIIALHKLIFEQEGDRNNRRRLREFAGFGFSDNSSEFRAKLQHTESFSIGDLISICNVLGIAYAGNAEQLRQRIVRALMDIDSLQPVRDEDESDEESDGEREKDDEVDDAQEANDQSTKSRKQGNTNNNTNQFVLSYRDVEDSVRSFNGTDAYPIERWISDFEEAAVMFRWNDLQKVVSAKKSLTGVAKLFVQSAGVLRTWKRLKDALMEEFSTKISSAQLHKMLEKRKMKREETVQEYFLTMRELASRGAVESDALFEHVINGINDEPSNKIILYGAKTIREFKDKLEVYGKMSRSHLEKTLKYPKRRNELPRRVDKKSSREDTKKMSNNQKSREQTRCFNCGESGHYSRNCDKKSLGKKCFICNKFGHEARNCSEKRGNSSNRGSEQIINLVNVSSGNMNKNIVINNVSLQALIDTGSPVSLVREDVFKRLKEHALIQSTRVFSGFGGGESKVLGYFQTVVYIDSDDYPLTLYVVPYESVNVEVVIGRDILLQANLSIDQDAVTIQKKSSVDFLAHINITDETRTDIEAIPDAEIKDRVEKLVRDYEPKKCKTTEVKLKIALKDKKPMFQRPRRLAIPEKEIVEKQIEEWIKEGIVEPCSSEYASPVVVVRKKDGSPRVCIDYRPLNRIIERDRHPLPLIEDQIDKLKDARVFSTLDLKNGFFHVEVDEESRKYTAFVTHEGQYQFLRAPFGLSNSPPVFQRYINQIFRPLVNTGIMTLYLDDVIILATDFEQAINRLEAVLVVASEYGLELNIKKCKFMRTRIEFLGQIIKSGTVFPSPEKVQAVMRFPELTTIKQVQSFLGLSGYFRKFVNKYSMIARPLSDLLRKEKAFQFGEAERKAFNELKQILSKEPVLQIFDPELETELHTDASQDGIGAILLQRSPMDDQLHPVQYMSRKSLPVERNYKSYELEVLAVIEALEKFRIYLLGLKFKIVTDCAAFTQTMRKKEVSPKIWRWAERLEYFDYILEHRPGVRMKHVDALSRNSIMTIIEKGVLAKIRAAQADDPEINTLRKTLESKPCDDYMVNGGILYKFAGGVDLLYSSSRMHAKRDYTNGSSKGSFVHKKNRGCYSKGVLHTKCEKEDRKIYRKLHPMYSCQSKTGQAGRSTSSAT